MPCAFFQCGWKSYFISLSPHALTHALSPSFSHSLSLTLSLYDCVWFPSKRRKKGQWPSYVKNFFFDGFENVGIRILKLLDDDREFNTFINLPIGMITNCCTILCFIFLVKFANVFDLKHVVFLVWRRPGVNFTNVLHAAFMYVSCACSFFVLTF